jgi:hypothetical protein
MIVSGTRSDGGENVRRQWTASYQMKMIVIPEPFIRDPCCGNDVTAAS